MTESPPLSIKSGARLDPGQESNYLGLFSNQ